MERAKGITTQRVGTVRRAVQQALRKDPNATSGQRAGSLVARRALAPDRLGLSEASVHTCTRQEPGARMSGRCVQGPAQIFIHECAPSQAQGASTAPTC